MSWTTLTLRVETPLFSGDDPQSDRTGSPIRVPSIRGVLRYWFRAVAAAHGITDKVRLWEEERVVFGSTDHPSPIRLRISGSPPASGKATKPKWAGGPGLGNRFHGAQYLLGQGLWHFRTGLTRPFVAPGDKFELDIRLSDSAVTNQRFLLAMWAWLTYGGLGARTRRGFGQLRCTGITGPLPEPFSAALTKANAVKDWERLATTAIPDTLRNPQRLDWDGWSAEQPSDDASLPETPALTPSWWQGVLFGCEHRDIEQALMYAGQTWRNFRAMSPSGSTPNQRTRSPEWADSIRGGGREYSVAALGLPVGYHSTNSGFDGSVEPFRQSNGQPEPLRRASPVWLRPVKLPNGKWTLFSHVFWARLLPDNARLRITRDGGDRELDVPSRHDIEYAWDAWLLRNDRMKPAATPRQ
jgi:CRISPR type III-B/RAMP module RAMP protein Cmr1